MAAPFESTDLSHFDAPEGALPPALEKRRAFYIDLARFASRTPSGRARATPVRCRKRPGRKPCGGLLVVRRRDLPAAVEWRCPACDAAGHITGWEDTDADLRQLETDPGPEAHAVAVSVPALDALRELTREEPGLVPLAYGAEIDAGGQPVLRITATDCLRFGPVLLRHTLTQMSRRRCELLGEVAVALAPEVEDEAAIAAYTEGTAATMEALVELARGPESKALPFLLREQPKKRRAAVAKTYQIKVTLRDVKPPVWRRLLVPSDIELPALHDVVQAAMGWDDCHLHSFRVGDREFALPGDFDPVGEDSRGVALAAIVPRKGSRVVYEYDFGDGWRHDILVEDILDDRCSEARCLEGRRRCPPEDCGGSWGYAELREALSDPRHERHEELREWAPADFDPEEFDVAYQDQLVRRVRV